MVRVRAIGVLFALVQVFTFYLPYPPGVTAAALTLVAVLALGDLAAAVAVRRTRSVRGARRLAVLSLLLDAAVVSGFVFVYTFDPETAIWAVIYILPLEGAIRFQRRGALLTMAGAAVAYTVREVYGQVVYDVELLPTSISFRMGIGFIIAGVAGAMASALVRDREQVEAADALKDDFIAMTNHELRTPLTTIMGYAQILADRWEDVDEARRREFAHRILAQSRRLSVLVEDLLTLSSAQAGAIDLDRQDIDVHAAVAEALVDLPDVRNQIPERLRVRADSRRLAQILINYLSNARKYGAPPVAVTAEERDGSVTIAVTDAGPGVPQSFVPHLFDKFTQASRGVSRTAEGTGLGLAIVRLLAQAQDGDAWYEPNPGGGSRFCVRLPRGAAADHPAGTSVARKRGPTTR